MMRRLLSHPIHALATSTLVLGAVAIGACHRPSPAPKPPPRLVVLMVADQMRGDELGAYDALWREGVRRLVDTGRWYANDHLDYARSETASGHATLATGLPPRLNGVVDKRIYDAERDKVRHVCDFDAPAPCGPGALVVPTLGDRLKAKYPTAKVVSLTNKARSAVLMGGRHADLVAWPERDRPNLLGHFGSDPLPRWLQLYYRQVAASDRIAHLWELPPLPRDLAARVDDAPGENGNGLGRTFPHRLPRGSDAATYEAWHMLPDSDRALVDLAGFVARRLELGRDEVPDLLLVSFSSIDTVGHEFGPDSLERVAALAALDRHVGDLLATLEELAGESVLVAFTADHGIAPTVAQAIRDGHPSAWIDADELKRSVDAALHEKLGPTAHVAALSFPFLFLTPMPQAQRSQALDIALEVLRRDPAVYGAWPTDTLTTSSDPIAKLLAESAYPGRSGDVAIALKPYYAPMSSYGGTGGSQHGSPWPYDRYVPLVLWGEGVTPGRVETPVTPEALVRTLADRLGLAPNVGASAPLP